jgi:hypothetical protein
MERSRRAFLGTSMAWLTAGCTWTSRWRTGERPDELVQNRTEPEEPVCEEWDDEPGNLSARITAPPILHSGREQGVEVVVRNEGPGDACFVADVVRTSDGVSVDDVALRVPPGRERTVPVSVTGRGRERYRIGDGPATDEVLVVPDAAVAGEPRRIDGVEVAVEDLVFADALTYESLAGREEELLAPRGERFGLVRVAATGLVPDACACVYGDVAIVTEGGAYDAVPDANGVIRGRDERIRPSALAGRYGDAFLNRRVGDGETAAGWIVFQVPVAVADADPLVRIGGEEGTYWIPG